MTEDAQDRVEVDRFILDHIHSVPHLEALLLLWRGDLDHWSVKVVAKRLWITEGDARAVLQDLARDRLIILVASETEQYRYNPELDNARLLQAVADAYRDEMIRISTMIHARPSSAVRAFASAFRFTKKPE